MTTAKRVLAGTGLGLLALALAACGGSSGTAASSTAPAASATVSEPAVGGTTTCNEATMTQAVADYAEVEGTEARVGPRGFTCAGDWAVVHMEVKAGADYIENNLTLRAEGQFWVPQDPAKVCPQPSEVPQEIYPDVCEAQ